MCRPLPHFSCVQIARDQQGVTCSLRCRSTTLSKRFITWDVNAIGLRLVRLVAGRSGVDSDIEKSAWNTWHNWSTQTLSVRGCTQSGPVALLTFRRLNSWRTSLTLTTIGGLLSSGLGWARRERMLSCSAEKTNSSSLAKNWFASLTSIPEPEQQAQFFQSVLDLIPFHRP